MTFRILFAFVLGLAGSNAWSAENSCEKFGKSVASGSDGRKLERFLAVQWKYIMTEFPEAATYVGHPGQDDRLTDYSESSLERRRKENLCMRDSLKMINRVKLKEGDRVTYDLALRNAELYVESDKFAGDYMPINHMDGFQLGLTNLLMAMPTGNVAHYDNMIKRLQKIPLLSQQATVLMREGMKRKAMPVKLFMPTVSKQLADLTPEKVEDSPFYLQFKNINMNIPAVEQKRLQANARDVIAGVVYPAIQQFRVFFDKEYAPAGRENIAWTEMPDGKAWYAYQIKHHTTTATTADDLHELGLKEVEKILSEMEKVRTQVKFKGDLQSFNKHLLKDKKFYFKDKEELLSAYRDIAKRADAELPKLFKTLPRLTYGVREIQETAAKGAAAAQYMPGSYEAGRPGYFEANTFKLDSRGKFGMETLTLHEAVPGHHLQIALAAEVKGLPEFRRFGGYTAFSEGWALYAETLGKEMGFFKDPYSYYGHLSDQMLRSVRLVVDTGMHAKGWTREKALAYYRSMMPASDVESENEINRYVTWPGQALAYKVGALKIRELRDKATEKLGAKFNVREFHDQVLLQGAMPLDVLEKHINEWTAAVAKAGDKKSSSTTHSTSM